MNEIGLKKGIVLFFLVFIAPAIVAQPLRPAIVNLVALPEPTLWQSVSMFFSTILVAGVVIYAYNQREEIKRLEREVERERYRRQHSGGEP